MRILVDAGNSGVKWACDAATPHFGTVPYQHADWERRLAEAWAALPRPSGVWVANVAGPVVTAALELCCRICWNLSPIFLQSRAHAGGVRNGYAQPQRLGIDRWVALLAARQRFDGALCVVDAGTALTLDALDAAGQHHGGLILPGVYRMRESLARHAHALRELALTPDERAATELLGRDTVQGIQLGTLYAATALIDKMAAALARQWQTPVQCVITGGDAGVLLPLLTTHCVHAPDLVLQGIALYADDPTEKLK